MSPIVTLLLSILSQLPTEVGAIETAVANVKTVFSAKDLATAMSLFAAMNTKTDTDYKKLEADVGAAQGSSST